MLRAGVSPAVAASRFPHRLLGFGWTVTETGENHQRLRHRVGSTGCRNSRLVAKDLVLELALQLEHHSGRGLWPDARYGGQQGRVFLQDRPLQHAKLGPAEDRERGFWSDALDRKQQLEEGQLLVA